MIISVLFENIFFCEDYLRRSILNSLYGKKMCFKKSKYITLIKNKQIIELQRSYTCLNFVE